MAQWLRETTALTGDLTSVPALTQFTTMCNSNSRGCGVLVSMGIRQACGAHTYMLSDTHTRKIKMYFKK